MTLRTRRPSRPRAIAGTRTCKRCGLPYRDSWKQCPRCTNAMGGRDGRVAGPAPTVEPISPMVVIYVEPPPTMPKHNYPEWLELFARNCGRTRIEIMKAARDATQPESVRNTCRACEAVLWGDAIPADIDLVALEASVKDTNTWKRIAR